MAQVFKNPMDQAKAMNPSTREKWNKYMRNGFTGNPRTIDKYNKLLGEIESELPFRDKAEHDKWLDLGSTWKGEAEWPDMTKMLLYRQENPIKDIKLDRKAFADYLKQTKKDYEDWGDRMDDIRETFKLDYPETIADLYIRGNRLYGLQTDDEDEPYEVELYNLLK